MRLLIPLMLLSLGVIEPHLPRLLREPARSARRALETRDTPAPVPPGAVRVFMPDPSAPLGAHVPVLYLGGGQALFLPEGAREVRATRVPSPSELVSLIRRRDIVIVTMDAEAPSAEVIPR
ncbi:hypothetical protein JGU66_10465 [Myxococcaceae bacterium JPH2]|nr:hypothetical protein [Myxococcaceae bacterium JPH2]